MSNTEAEWFDVDKEFPLRPFPPDKPRATSPPRRIPIPRPTRRPTPIPAPRPTSPTPRPDVVPPHDAKDRMPPLSPQGLSSAVIISVSLVSCIVALILVLALFYFLVLKRRFPKLDKPPPATRQRDDYSIRIEDVAHLSMEETDAIYMNTTDLQKLVSMVRSKSKIQPPEHKSSGSNFPDVVQVTQPVTSAPLASQSPRLLPKSRNLYKNSINAIKTSPPAVPVAPNKSVSSHEAAVVSRPAPPPPSNKKAEEIKPTNKPRLPLLPKPSIENLSQIRESTSNQNQKPGPPVLPKPSSHKMSETVTTIPNDSTFTPKAPPPKVAAKPTRYQKPEIIKPTPPSTINKPNNAQGSLKKPILPPLKMNQLIKNSVDSTGNSTPDTATSYLVDTSESESEPERMSVRAKRIFLENAMTTERPKKVP